MKVMKVPFRYALRKEQGTCLPTGWLAGYTELQPQPTLAQTFQGEL